MRCTHFTTAPAIERRVLKVGQGCCCILSTFEKNCCLAAVSAVLGLQDCGKLDIEPSLAMSVSMRLCTQTHQAKVVLQRLPGRIKANIRNQKLRELLVWLCRCRIWNQKFQKVRNWYLLSTEHSGRKPDEVDSKAKAEHEKCGPQCQIDWETSGGQTSKRVKTACCCVSQLTCTSV